MRALSCVAVTILIAAMCGTSAAAASGTVPASTGLSSWGLGATGQDTGVPVQVGTDANWAGSGGLGYWQSCARRTGGTLWCWGLNDSGQLGVGDLVSRYVPTQVGTASDWAGVSGGRQTTCATKSNGELWCWGSNYQGALGTGTSASYVTVPARVGTATNWTSVSVGNYHVCARRSDGTAWCWGANFYGELGNGGTASADTPVQVGSSTHWSAVASGDSHSCGVRTDGTLWCWGQNWFGQLGIGTTPTTSPIPLQVGTAATWAWVVGGGNSTCAGRRDHSLWCWGENEAGKLGVGDTTDRSTPTQVGTAATWTAVTLGTDHTCGRQADATLWCWGYGGDGRLGIGDVSADPQRLVPTEVGTATNWSSISTGGAHTCARRSNGTLWCWGTDFYGELATRDPRAPAPIVASTAWTQLSAGPTHACGIQTGGTLLCWGYNWYGALGLGFIGDEVSTPHPVTGGGTWTSVSAGGTYANSFSCGIKPDKTLWCWGVALGVRDEPVYAAPVQVGSVTSWGSVSSGEQHACAVRTNHTLWCWGADGTGQLGIGTTGDRRSRPNQVGTDTDWATVSAGGDHTCARKSDRSLWCWGDNSHGELGLGDTTLRDVPTRVGTGTTWSSVTAGGTHTCARRSDGTLWCWGANGFGQLGLGDTAERSVPTQVGVATNWAGSGALSGAHTCARQNDNSLWCWGSNSSGELGLGDQTQRSTPTRVGSARNWSAVTVGDGYTIGLAT